MKFFSRLASRWFCFATLLVCLSTAQTNFPSPSQDALPSIGGPSAMIVPPPLNYRFPDGQTYVYGVEWRLFTAGTARVKLQAEGSEQHVTATAVSSGFVNAFHKVNDRLDAFFDPHKFCTIRVSKHLEEGARSREAELRFDYSRGKSVLDEKNLANGELKHVENDIPACVTDVVSGFYYLASLPLQPGSINRFSINDGGNTTEVIAEAEAHEKVKVPAGKFQTVRVRAEAISGAMQGKGTVWAWFSEDGNHVPVQMRSKLRWGTLTFRLQRVEGQ